MQISSNIEKNLAKAMNKVTLPKRSRSYELCVKADAMRFAKISLDIRYPIAKQIFSSLLDTFVGESAGQITGLMISFFLLLPQIFPNATSLFA